MVTIMIKHMEVHKSDAGSRQGQAEQLRNSRNKFHQTTHKPF